MSTAPGSDRDDQRIEGINSDMRIGTIQILHWELGRTAEDLYAEAADKIIHADALGYYSAWMTEHHFPHVGRWSVPATRSIRIRLRFLRMRPRSRNADQTWFGCHGSPVGQPDPDRGAGCNVGYFQRMAGSSSA